MSRTTTSLLGQPFYPLTLEGIQKFVSFNTSFEKTEKNLKETAQLVAELFGFFLTDEAHTEKNIKELDAKGICVYKQNGNETMPNSAKKEAFIANLKDKILQVVDKGYLAKVSTKLGENTMINEVLEKIEIPPETVQYLFPLAAKVQIFIRDKDFQLTIQLGPTPLVK